MRKRRYTLDSSGHAERFLVNHTPWTEDDPFRGLPVPEVHNLVGTCKVNTSACPLNLRLVAKILPNAVFDKQKFAAITVRLSTPSCTVLLFTSGKMVLTGSKTYMDCLLAARHVCALLRRGFPGMRFKIGKLMIQNIVGNVDIRLASNEVLDLEGIHHTHDVECTYQRNMFPGLIFRPLNSRVVLLIFTSGKIVLTGAKCTQDLAEEWKSLWPRLMQYIKKT